MKIAVLMGGASAEREVSLSSGVQVARALREAGHDVTSVDTAEGVLGPGREDELVETGVRSEPPDPEKVARLSAREMTTVAMLPEVASADVVFIALHGGAGEDGTLQAVLDLSGVPYAGSGHLACAMAMDKEVSKRLFREAGVPTPEWRVAAAGEDRGPRGIAPREAVDELGLPLVVKPASGGSTLGLTVAREASGVAPAVEEARRYGGEVLLERYTPGREVTVGVLEDAPLPVGEIIPEHDIFDYECKYQPGLAREVFPADLPEAAARRTRELALEVHRALKMSDFSRVDFILDGEGVPWCLEANALPGMTPTSLVPQAAAAAGVPFPELCDRIVRSALTRRSAAATPR